jgi:hypothetical protein
MGKGIVFATADRSIEDKVEEENGIPSKKRKVENDK